MCVRKQVEEGSLPPYPLKDPHGRKRRCTLYFAKGGNMPVMCFSAYFICSECFFAGGASCAPRKKILEYWKIQYIRYVMCMCLSTWLSNCELNSTVCPWRSTFLQYIEGRVETKGTCEFPARKRIKLNLSLFALFWTNERENCLCPILGPIYCHTVLCANPLLGMSLSCAFKTKIPQNWLLRRTEVQRAKKSKRCHSPPKLQGKSWGGVKKCISSPHISFSK